MAETRGRGVEVGIAILLAAGATSATIGAAVDGKTPAEAHELWLAAALCLLAAVVLFGWYFALHPLMLVLERKRAQWIARERAALAEAQPTTGGQQPRYQGTNFRVRRAEYGVRSDDRWEDVTERVLAKVSPNGRLILLVSNDELGGDPFPDEVKHLRLQYWNTDGEGVTATYEEGSRVDLP